MASRDHDDESEDPRSVLVDCIADPENSRERLPYVMSLFDDDDREVRLSAAWACCLVAVADGGDDVVEYLVRRLSDRLSEDPPLEVTQALDYLAARNSEQVGDILEAVAEEGDERVPFPEVGSFTRSHYYGSVTDRDGEGRARIPESEADDPRRTYADREREEREHDEYERAREAEGDRGDGSGGEGGAGDGESEEEYTADPEAMIRRTNELSALAVHSRFDELHVVGARSRGRYADTYQALLGRGGEERAVAVRLFRQPDDVGARPTFEDDVTEQLRGWTRVDDHDHVVTVLDWNTDPRPWLATTFTSEQLADRDPLRTEQAMVDARNLTSAVSHLHQHGVVHGGIDPKNVSYPGELMDGGEVRPPMLDNVGLMHVFRYHFEPALCLDPRYAAPEYFDDRFGSVDHETDIYGLGAVLFRLFTGRPPFVGGFEEVRSGVLNDEPPRPSAVADVPAGLDEIVSKAMAKQKLTRYETVEHMESELSGIDG